MEGTLFSDAHTSKSNFVIVSSLYFDTRLAWKFHFNSNLDEAAVLLILGLVCTGRIGSFSSRIEMQILKCTKEYKINKCIISFPGLETMAVACCAYEKEDLDSILALSKCFSFGCTVGWNQTQYLKDFALPKMRGGMKSLLYHLSDTE